MNNLSAHISQICRFLFREYSFRIDTSGLLLWQYTELLLPRLSKILERTKVLHLKPISRRVYIFRLKISCFRSLRSSCEAPVATLSFDVPSIVGSVFVGSICACDVQLNLKSEPFRFIDVIPDSDLTVTCSC